MDARTGAERPRVVSREEWLVERRAHLENEKELTRKLDELKAERRRLPWVRIAKNYVFDGPDDEVSLSDLFEGRRMYRVRHNDKYANAVATAKEEINAR